MKIKAPFVLEYTKRRNTKCQVVYVRCCRIVKIGGQWKTLQDWAEQILFWWPGKGTRT